MMNIDKTKKTVMKNLQWPASWKPNNAKRLPAWEKSLALKFPLRKNEDWRWVNFQALDLDELMVESANVSVNEVDDGYTRFIQNFETEQTANLKALEAKRATVNDDKFSALNDALATNDYLIRIPKNEHVSEAIHVKHHFDANNTAAFTRALIVLEQGAQAKIVLEFSSDESLDKHAIFNYRLDIWLEDGAKLDLVEVQEFGEQVSYISHEHAQVGKDAHLNWNYIALGTRISKNFITVDLTGPGSETLMNGVYFCGTGQLIDLDTQQNHLSSNAHSDLLYKGAVVGEGKAVWEGMIFVDPIAQQTNAYQSNRNLILDERAEVKTIPGLEINANDVSCSHGATVGRLNADELFYAESRGINIRDAEKLIVEGFFAEVLNKSGDEALTESVLKQISDKFDLIRSESIV